MRFSIEKFAVGNANCDHCGFVFCFTDHFVSPGSAIGPLHVCVCSCSNFRIKLASDIDIHQGGSPLHSLQGQVRIG